MAQWIEGLNADCRAALRELWKRRKEPNALDRIGELFPEGVAETVRREITRLLAELRCEYSELISTMRVYLDAMSDLPEKRPL
jgi:hypothetical protein